MSQWTGRQGEPTGTPGAKTEIQKAVAGQPSTGQILIISFPGVNSEFGTGKDVPRSYTPLGLS